MGDWQGRKIFRLFRTNSCYLAVQPFYPYPRLFALDSFLSKFIFSLVTGHFIFPFAFLTFDSCHFLHSLLSLLTFNFCLTNSPMLQRKHSELTYLDSPSLSEENSDILVMLHGYGSNEKDLIQLASLLDNDLRSISPRAPLQLAPEMYGWFPLEFTSEGISVDREKARSAKETLLVFLRHIIDEYKPPEGKIWLMGFSQGSVMAYLSALAEPSLFHGIIALSGQFPYHSSLFNRDPERFRTLPFLVVHGLYDDVLPVSNGRISEAWLKDHLDSLTYREYTMGHEINAETLETIRQWLSRMRSGDAGR